MPASPGKPTWAVRIRTAEGEPSRDIHVAARSILQAEAIVKRQGAEIVEGATRLTDRNPDPENTLLAAAPGPLHCLACGYHLDGLVVKDAIIECPECGRPQVVLAYRHRQGVNHAAPATWKDLAMGCAMVVFAVLVVTAIVILVAVL